ncbi:MAG: crosslink repair DNA glycosylase YcaQ family protein [Candidatus Promineifilaceae bacterium]
MKPLHLSKMEARRFILAHQGLWPPLELKGKDAVLDTIRRLGCIQFDPLNIVGRNPELVLQARVSDFRPEMLGELLYEDRLLIDGWDKNMSIYGLEDWPYFQRYRDAAHKRFGDDSQPAVSILPQVRKMIHERGPLSSIDLEFDDSVDWSWGPTRIARAALESMYSWGELVIHHRVNTRKVYDFASRHVPDAMLSAGDPNESDDRYHDWRILRRIQGLGLIWNRSGDAWLGFRGIKSKDRMASFDRLVDRGLLIAVRVEGIEPLLYFRSEDEALLVNSMDTEQLEPRAVILAPLDNLLWDRRYVKQLFDFYYIWEVYKPVVERQYGYYVLPILYGDRFIARFEPGRDKESGAMLIKNWWWESGVDPSERMQSDLQRSFAQFLSYLGTDSMRIEEPVARQNGLEWLPLPT